MTLATFSPQLLLMLLEEFDAPSLAYYCSTEKKSVDLCNDPYFWRRKIRQITRQRVQEDWIVPLAQLGEERLLTSLFDAVDRDRLPIDDWVVTLALMHLYVQNRSRDTKLITRFEDRRSIESAHESHVAFQDFYNHTLYIYDNIDAIVEQWRLGHWVDPLPLL